jgi:hypothetical protein
MKNTQGVKNQTTEIKCADILNITQAFCCNLFYVNP